MGSLSYTIKPLGHACPAQSPAHVLLSRAPLGPLPWLHRLRTLCRPGLFASFIATTKRSDFSRSFFIGFDSSSSQCGPLRYNSSGQAGDLPVLAQGAYLHARVSDHAGSSRHSHYRACPCCLPPIRRRRHPELIYCFRGSMAGLQAPLSTFRRAPRDALRMTRGQSDLLFLYCQRLSLFAPCRSPGAPEYNNSHYRRGEGRHYRAP
jgi:hypothetical protein